MSNGQKINCNVLIDSKNIFDQSIRSDSNQNIRNIRKTGSGQENGFTAGY